MGEIAAATPGGGASASPSGNPAEVATSGGTRTLYVALGPDGSFKVGTCAHCVAEECGRPARAWDADGDKELDFNRDELLAHLAELGVHIADRQAYVCP